MLRTVTRSQPAPPYPSAAIRGALMEAGRVGGARYTLLSKMGRISGESSLLQNFILNALEDASGVLLTCLVDVKASEPPSPRSSFISLMLTFLLLAVAVTACLPFQKLRSPSGLESPMIRNDA